MRSSGRPPYSLRDPSRPSRGGDRAALSIGALASRLMSLRASLTRRLAGLPQRPGYAVSATRPPASWMTSPQAMLGRSDGYQDNRTQEPPLSWAEGGAWVNGQRGSDQSWPAEVFDDRASPETFAPRPESRIDVAASGPGLLVRQPRRPAAIAPEYPVAASAALAPVPARPAASPEAVRFTRTPDSILQERRQRARDAEAARIEEAARLAETARIEAETRAREAAEAAEAASLAQAAALSEAAALAESVAASDVPLWRQPFVAPPGVRFFRTPDRRAPAPRPETAAIPPTPQPEPRDWSDLGEWSALSPWFDGDDWSAVEAWSALQGGPAVPETAPVAAPSPSQAFAFLPPAAVARRPEAPASGFVSVPLDVTLLRALPRAPAYALDRMMRFEAPARGADGQDNAAGPVLTLVPTETATLDPVPAPARPVHAMAARAAIRAGQSVAVPPAGAREPAPAPAPVARPVLLRSKSAPQPDAEPAPSKAEVEAVRAEKEAAAERIVADVIAFAPPSPAAEPPPALSAAPIVGRPHLVSASRHVGVASFDSAGYELPALDLLALPQRKETGEVDADVLEQNALNLQQTVQDFGVKGDILAVRPGPVVTLYELEPAPGTKSSRVIALADDIARSMSAVSARVAVVPGRNVIGIELPNDERETVYLRELLSAGDFHESRHKLALCLGKNIGGEPIIADLA
ncbi:MAG: cell division protein FtsK, partial [Methylobacterium sp. CG08_land_8_20_14_0_20_71_15]